MTMAAALMGTARLTPARDGSRHIAGAIGPHRPINPSLQCSASCGHLGPGVGIFDAPAAPSMAGEAALAEGFVKPDAPVAERLAAFVLTIRRRKRVKFAEDPEMHTRHRRMVEERPDLVSDYARRMTGVARSAAEKPRNSSAPCTCRRLRRRYERGWTTAQLPNRFWSESS